MTRRRASAAIVAIAFCVAAMTAAAQTTAPSPAADSAAPDEPMLEFLVSEKVVGTLTLAELQDRLETRKLELFDPLHGKQKHYSGFALHDVIKLGFGSAWNKDSHSEVVISALDGYKAVSTRKRLNKKGGFIVYHDADIERGWERIGRGRVDPGPFYLVWTGDDQGPEDGYPWPWQIRSIALLRFSEQFPAVFPKGVSKDSPVRHGFDLFKTRCVQCHAMDRQGGTVGPDLNAPKSIVTYRAPDRLRDFIRQPSQFRHTKMPDHTDLSDEDLDALLDYFWFMSRR